jgi:small subunit ribosomal protein S16
MVKIRLRRMGAKRNPYYRIVIADSKSPRDGRFIEEIGTYNPLTSPSEINIDVERAEYWVKNGAQPTDTVRALLKKAGAIKADTSEAVSAKESDAPEKAEVSTEV